MYLDVKYSFRPNPKCRAEVVRYVERMYSLSEVKSKCGQTDVDAVSYTHLTLPTTPYV